VAFRGQKVQTTADPGGRWQAWLAPMTPGSPQEMTIQGNNTIRIADVLVGDVWIGSGQSNMQWAVRQSNNAEAEIASAKHPEIRLFYVPRKPSPVPVEDVDAKWVVCTPESVRDFSAVLFYFGRELHQILGRDPDRVMDQRSRDHIEFEARPHAHVLGKSDRTISRKLLALRAEPEEMGRERQQGAAPAASAGSRPSA
jgi:hypothetical protein